MSGPTSSVSDKVLSKSNTGGPRSGYSWGQENTKEIVIRPWDCDFHHLHITAGLRVNQSVFAHQPLPRNSCVHTHTHTHDTSHSHSSSSLVFTESSRGTITLQQIHLWPHMGWWELLTYVVWMRFLWRWPWTCLLDISLICFRLSIITCKCR